MDKTDFSRDSGTGTRPENWWFLATRRSVVVRALKVCGFVGTLLVIINQGDNVLAGYPIDFGKLILTYFVPYGVSTFSAVAALREEHKAAEVV